MNKITWCSLLLLSCLTNLDGAVVKGRWAKIDALANGTLVKVSTRSGEEFSAVFRSADALSLIFAVDDREKTMPKSEIRRVVLEEEKEDPTWDGLVWGAAIGGGAGAAVGAIGAGNDNDQPWQFGLVSRGEGAAIGGILGAGVGALLGFVLDKTHEQPEVLYEAR